MLKPVADKQFLLSVIDCAYMKVQVSVAKV